MNKFPQNIVSHLYIHKFTWSVSKILCRILRPFPLRFFFCVCTAYWRMFIKSVQTVPSYLLFSCTILSPSFYRPDLFLFLSLIVNSLYTVYIRYIHMLNAMTVISSMFLENSLRDSKLIDKQKLKITNGWMICVFLLYSIFLQFSGCFTRYT